MSLLKHLFGKKNGPVSDEMLNLQSFSKTAQENISEALTIVEGHVKIGPGNWLILSTGSEGMVMEAARKFEAACNMHPENPLLQYVYASCLHLAMQYKSAEDEMKKCAETHPNFIHAKLAVKGWEKWRSMFILPPWGKTTKTVHPALSETVQTSILLAVRDVIVPRTTLFLRDAHDDFQDQR